MKLLKLVQRKIRTLKRRYILKKCIEQAGGNEVRNQLRGERLSKIREAKRTEIASLVMSWKIKEIKPPTDEEYYKFFFQNSLTVSYIESTRKKYWEDH
jgi:hypothetical protein